MHGLEPEAIRRETLTTLRDASEADAAVFYTVRVVEGVPRFTEVLISHDDSDLAPELRRLSDRPVTGIPTLRLDRPPLRERRGFTSFRERWRGLDFSRTWIHRELYGPCEISDEIRLLVFRGRRFVGWLGAWRRGGERFAPNIGRILAPLVEPAVSALSLAEELAPDPLGDEGAHLVVDPRGVVQHASKAAVSFAEPPRREMVARVVRAFDRGEGDGRGSIAGCGVRTVRLDGEAGVAYLVLVTPGQRVELSAEADLTPAQQEVARHAAAGATVRQISRSLGKRPETVRSHLREIYRRLGIASRAELAGMVRPA